MKSWTLAAAGFGFAAAFTAAPAQAGTLEEQAACHREFMACRTDGCPPV